MDLHKGLASPLDEWVWGETQKAHAFEWKLGFSGDSGLLGCACACACVLMCMLGCLSNLVAVGFFENIPSCSGKNKGQFSASLPTPSSHLLLSWCLKARRETLYPDEGFEHFSAESH